jgi:DNA-binding transcriptional MerR regulator/methylmalonyl-CoA mutase cobalamin-binding subunit
MSTPAPYLSISAVERETGLSKDVLRKWEGRYGFPRPLRDAFGERIYPPDQVNRLRLIKRLMDTGMRPSSIVAKEEDALLSLAASRHVTPAAVRDGKIETAALELLRKHDPEDLRLALHRLLLRQGLASFVQDTVTPLNHAVGEAWARGELEIYEEHLYTEVVQGVLRNAMSGITDRHGRPRVLLTTLPEEPHGLGILMVAAMLALEGAYCLSLGPQTPLEEIANAARAQAVDVVVLSFSIIYPPRRIPPALEELRQRLDPAIEIWAGGAGTARLHRAPAGTRLLPTMEDAMAALADWRAAAVGMSPAAGIGAKSPP